jgi:Zn-dependent protease
MDATLAEKFALFLVLLGSLSIHEWAHAWVADKLGDPTPRAMGRVTLNPLAHIDLLGTVIIPLTMILLAPGFAILGWGKPVIIDPRNFKKPIRDDILTSLAGPASNLLLALGAAIIFGAWVGITHDGVMAEKIVKIGFNIIFLNALLCVFNLIPIPPLDGSHVLRHLVKMSDLTFIQFAQWGSLILIILINLDPFQELLRNMVLGASAPFGAVMEMVAGIFTRGR